MDNKPLLQLEGLRVGFGQRGQLRDVLHGLDLRISRGEAVGLVGESGSGKSVTALAIMGLLGRHGAVTGGRILFDGRDLAQLPEATMRTVRGKEISMIFQDPTTALNPAFTIGTQLLDVMLTHRPLSAAVARKEALELLDQVGFQDPARVLRSYPHELSGGMRQRAMIAMAVSCRPKLVLADEPTTALDVTVQAQIVELLRRLVKELDLGLLFITHNLDLMGELCGRAVVLLRGDVVEQGSAADLFEQPRHPYTRMLFDSIPRLELAP
ncbi:MAG TPA: ABC transporter ATP-binding protein [Ramlibacter sp.]|nr:ABC transporter ATP-binding protein [Ramlibacter sp.]